MLELRVIERARHAVPAGQVAQFPMHLDQACIAPMHLFGEAPLIGTQPPDIEGLAHGSVQRFPLPGLGQITVNAAVIDGADRAVHVRITGQQETQGVRCDALDLLQQRDPREAGHLVVRDDQRILLSRQPFERFARIGARLRVIAGSGRFPRQGLQVGLFIVHEQDAALDRFFVESIDAGLCIHGRT